MPLGTNGVACSIRPGVLLVTMLAAMPAHAELGGARRSVDADRLHLAATMTLLPAPTHMVHRLTQANGGSIREFVNADGVVFAVAWAGPGRPDLRQLLGPAFATFDAAVLARRGRSHRAVMVEHDDLVIRSVGHPGAFRGFAYLPAAVPAGFPADGLE